MNAARQRVHVALLMLSAALLPCAVAQAAGAPLVAAAQADDHAAAVALIAKGEDVNERSADGSTALLWAVHNEDVDLVQRLIRAGARVGVANEFGATPMSEASIVADVPILKLLLKAGANVDSPNAEGQTALMIVARTGNVEAARLLVSHGARVDAREQWGGQTALMWAAAESQPEMVKFLLQHHADPNARSVIRDWQRRVTAEGRPKDENNGGFTPLLFAARQGCIQCAKYLLKYGAKINLQDPDGVTPLLLALINMHFDFAAELIRDGADVNLWDFFGRTPLYAAVDMNTLPTGGRPDLPSLDNLTGYDIAQMLLAKGADPNIQLKLRPPYRNGVYDRGGDEVLSTGATPLLLAAKVGDVDSVKLLLKYHALVNLPTARGVTPLMAAAGMGQSFNPTRGRYKTDAQAAECVKLIQQAGGVINARADDGMTALHAAAEHGWNDTVRVLVADGADLQPKNDLGLTPIDYAFGKQPRAFLEPQHVKHTDTIALLTGYIVKATGKPPIEYAGTMDRATIGTGGVLRPLGSLGRRKPLGK